jgi:hypothetical protein
MVRRQKGSPTKSVRESADRRREFRGRRRHIQGRAATPSQACAYRPLACNERQREPTAIGLVTWLGPTRVGHFMRTWPRIAHSVTGALSFRRQKCRSTLIILPAPTPNVPGNQVDRIPAPPERGRCRYLACPLQNLTRCACSHSAARELRFSDPIYTTLNGRDEPGTPRPSMGVQPFIVLFARRIG